MTSPLLHLRRRRLAWALLALPALLLRALIPPGFMPVAAEQGFALEFCPDAAALPPGAAPASAHAHHHHHEHGGGGSHPPCVFAASATLASAPAAPPPVAVPVAGGVVAGSVRANDSHLPSIIRAQTPRGPPFSA
jgi:hypothetical protein